MAIESKKVVYLGAFLTAESKALLLKACPARHSIVFAEHVTLAFRPSADEIADFMPRIGEEVKLVVVSETWDSKGQVVAVGTASKIRDERVQPLHITISCSEGTKPVYSKELLAQGPMRQGAFDLFGFPLTAVLDSFPSSR